MRSDPSLMPDALPAAPAAGAVPDGSSTDLPRPAPGAGRTLPATVAGQLRERIIQGEFAPGARLNERALCDRLGVSRTPLREAFRVLAAEGLVRIEPNRGAQVVALGVADIREAFEVIGGLEAMSCRLACERATDAEIAEIRALTFEMMASHARRDLPTFSAPTATSTNASAWPRTTTCSSSCTTRRTRASRTCASCPTKTSASGTRPCASTSTWPTPCKRATPTAWLASCASICNANARRR